MRFFITVALLLAIAVPALAQSTPTYKDPSAPLETRVNDLFSQLTPDEKLSLLSGTGFTTQPIPRLGVPAMAMADAGQGVRGGPAGTLGQATLFPAEVDMAQSWDPDLLHRIGRAIGDEARNKGGVGVQILLGPDINIHRSPLGGRDSESFTEDPYLNGQLATAYILGLQTSGDAACVKHFAANNEESDRNTVNVDVSERTLREIYLPGFKAAVEDGGAYSVMAAYNKVDGPYCTANHHLETDILKGDWGFTGIVMSDWGAVHETAAPVAAGCDLEMPGGSDMTPDKLKAALAAGQITQAEVDESVRRILRTIIRVGLLDGPLHPDASVVNSPDHQKLAYEAATKAVVLLKNDNGALPLDATKIHTIAVIGPGAVHLQAGAQGSPAVNPFYQITPLDGIKKRVGDGIMVNYVQGVELPNARPDAIPSSALMLMKPEQPTPGLYASYYTSADLSGQPAQTRIDTQINTLRFGGAPSNQNEPSYGSAQWSGWILGPVTGTYTISLTTRAACRVVIDGKTVIDDTASSGQFFHSGTVHLEGTRPVSINVEITHNDGPIRARLGWLLPAHNDIPGAVAAAKAADVAIVVLTTAGTDGEGRDRPSMDLPGDQDALVQAVAVANKNTIVVLNVGSPVTVTKWLKNVPAVVDMGYSGEEAGNGIASVLFGDVNPSGKLTDTFGARRQDYPDYGNFPGTNGTVHYAEGVFVGYRHFDQAKLKPIFPFGYGLSYTTFKYSNLKLSSKSLAPDGTLKVMADITNTGNREGAEVAELYVHDPKPAVDRPLRELKGFSKVDLNPGETKTVTFALAPSAFAYFDETGHQWKANAGSYDIQVGSSERDIKLTGHVRLTSDFTAAP
jgi:beta-glucosidase